MIIANYVHRLPVNHDMTQIRARARERGPQWDKMPELYFKGFLVRERGRFGAIANSYSSLYLWRQDEAFRDFVMSGKYNIVTDTFGRAEIQTTFALDARRGQSQAARFAYKETIDIPLDADLPQACKVEVERNREIAGRPGVVVAAVGVDTQNWRFVRVMVSEDAPTGKEAGTSYEVGYFAAPLLDTLPINR
jgi:Domain of unknown function (DUF4865)